ncbi:MAG TPA: alpha-2-macroglobulin family protein [Spirochaetota bacterium]|nr:alpha-2-macroglobulin family protein [Spirochaetota bacterium]
MNWNRVVFFLSLLLLILGTSCKKKVVDNVVKIDEKAVYIDNIKDDPGPLTIEDYSPKGVMPIETTDSQVWVSFSKPMVPLARLGKEINESVVEIFPAIEGVFRWYGSRLLAFEPKGRLLPSQLYTVKVKNSAASLSGAKLEGKREFTFTTETLKALNFYPKGGNVAPDQSKNIVITFNMAFDPNELIKFVEVKDKKKVINYNIEIPNKTKYKDYDEDLLKRMLVLNLKETPSVDSDVIITIKKGARPGPNSIGTESDIELKYHTLTPFKFVKFFSGEYEYGSRDYRCATIVFSQPVQKKDIEKFVFVSLPGIEDIKKHISVDSPLSEGEDDYYGYSDNYYDDYYYGYGSSYGSSIRLSGLPVEYNSSYSITVNKGLKDIYGQTLGEAVIQEVEVGDANSYYSVRDSGNKILESQFSNKYYIEFQNIFQGKYAIKSSDDPFYKFKIEELQPMDFSGIRKNYIHYEQYDLANYLKNGKGVVNMSWSLGERMNDDYNMNSLNLQVTDIGISLRYAYNKFDVLVGKLSDGAPISDATVNIKNAKRVLASGKTDNFGLASINFEKFDWNESFINFKNYDDRFIEVEVEKGDDKLRYKVDPYSHNLWKFNIYYSSSPENIKEEKKAAFIFTDRGLYKPGETVTYKGIDRSIILGEFSCYNGASKIKVMDNYYSDDVIHSSDIFTSEIGSFDGSFTLPGDIEPGFYTIYYNRKKSTSKGSEYEGSATFQVANFRRLNFSAKASVAPIIWRTGDTISATISAEYLGGGALRNGKVETCWEKRPYNLRPKDEKLQSYLYGPQEYGGLTFLTSESGVLSGNGSYTSKQVAEKGIEGQAYLYEVTGNVSDIDRQTISCRANAVVHPADFYIGAKLSSGANEGYWSTFVSKGKEFGVDIVTINPDEKSYDKSAKISVKLIYEDWKLIKQKGIGGRIQTRYEKVETVEKETSVNASGGKGSFKISAQKSGSYSIIFESLDSKLRKVITKIKFYSTGSDWVVWNGRSGNSIDMVPDKSIYKPGDVANILMKSPLKAGNYLITVEREGIIDEKVVKLDGNAHTIPITIKEDYIPQVYVAVTSYSGRTEAPPSAKDIPDLGKPKGYFGIVRIPVDVSAKSIQLTITKDKNNYRPKDEVTVKIKATIKGEPLEGAEITYLAADRGVLDLIDYHIPNPIDFFYSEYYFPLGVRGGDSRDLLIDPITYELEDQPGGDGDDAKQNVRKDFRATAVFEPTLITDANGEATLKFKLPDSLTTFRDTAFAVTADLFGIKEGEIKTGNPINVRTAFPRKLRIFDKTKCGVIVTNLTDSNQKVTVSVENDLIKILSGGVKEVTVKSGMSEEVAFDMEAVVSGKANFKFTIKSDALNETLLDTIVVEEPTIFEAFTIVGKTETEVTEGLEIPKDVKNSEGGASISIDSSRFASLKGAFDYFRKYPYECLEQRVSRIFPLVMFGDAAKDFGLDGGEKDVKGAVSSLLKELSAYQKYNGGFSYWTESWSYANYYLSLRVAHLLIRAKEFGFKIPKNLDLELLKTYIKTEYVNSKYLSAFNKAYACYVLSLDGENIKTRGNELENVMNYLPISGRALLALAYINNGYNWEAKKIFNALSNYITVGTKTVDITQPKEAVNDCYFWNEEADMALLLTLYSKLKADSGIIEGLVNSIMSRQKSGYWGNTHSTGWILYSFANLFRTESGKNTNFLAKISLGGNEIINNKFKGISESPVVYDISITELLKLSAGKTLPLSFKKDGDGTLFYSATLKYALNSDKIEARDEGISVYSKITDDSSVEYDNTYKLGQTYKYTVYISSGRDREFMAVRIPLPSGAEPIDGSFVTSAGYSKTSEVEYDSGSEYSRSNTDLYWYSPYPVQKIYDNEVRYHIDRYYKGTLKLSFQFRTTTPGVYPTPPCTVELMYEPEVFGRTAGKIIEIK